MRLRSALLRLAMLGGVAVFAACGDSYDEPDEFSITGPEIPAAQAETAALVGDDVALTPDSDPKR